MPEPLIPDDARQAYSGLIEIGGARDVPSDDPVWNESGVRWLFEARLCGNTHRKAARLTATIPVAAFERLLARSQRGLAP